MIASGDGHIVNVSSLFGLIAVPGQSAYNAAKFAVRGFTEVLRQEMLVAGHPVQVTCAHPGGIKTAVARNATVCDGEDAQSFAEFFDKYLALHSPEMAAQTAHAVRARSRPDLYWPRTSGDIHRRFRRGSHGGRITCEKLKSCRPPSDSRRCHTGSTTRCATVTELSLTKRAMSGIARSLALSLDFVKLACCPPLSQGPRILPGRHQLMTTGKGVVLWRRASRA